jgi:hypothetical protein
LADGAIRSTSCFNLRFKQPSDGTFSPPISTSTQVSLKVGRGALDGMTISDWRAVWAGQEQTMASSIVTATLNGFVGVIGVLLARRWGALGRPQALRRHI